MTADDIDRAETEKFLAIIGRGATRFSFQTFDDDKARRDALAAANAQRKREGKRKLPSPLVRVLHGSLDQHFDALARLNNAGAGVFVTINATNLRGRTVEDVVEVRCLFVDLDHGGLPTEWARKPHVVVESSSGKYHVDWLVDGCALDDFKARQLALLARYGGDKAINYLNCVLRLPGFHHRKGEPRLVRIIEVNDDIPPYAASDFPSAPEEPRRDRGNGAAGPPGANIDAIEWALREMPNLSLEEVGGDVDDPRYYDRDRWLAVCMSVHHEYDGAPRGFDPLWAWTARNPDYADAEAKARADDIWASFDGSAEGPPSKVRKYSAATVFHFANITAPGWRDRYYDAAEREIEAAGFGDDAVYAEVVAEVARERAAATTATDPSAKLDVKDTCVSAGEQPSEAASATKEGEKPKAENEAGASSSTTDAPSSSSPSSESGAEKETDLGNARRLVRYYGEDVRYVPAWKSWLVWRDGQWRRDDDGAVVRFAKATAERMLAGAFAIPDADARKSRILHALKSQDARRLAAMVDLARTEIAVVLPVSRLDADPYVLGVENGIVDLRTGQFRPARRDDYVTKRARVAFDPDARCPNWEAFLKTIFVDDDLIAYVQRAIGYGLTGTTVEEVVFVLWGKGANGKSTFRETIFALLGDYAVAADASLLVSQKNSGGATPDVARLFGRRLVTINETAQNDRLNEARVKFLTSQDMITARNLFENPFDFAPSHKPFLTTNHKPIVWGTDHGIWRRINLWPFTVTIPKGDRDEHFRERKLLPELAGILNWAIAGLLKYHEDGLKPPSKVVDATNEYRQDMDEIGRWIEERCEFDKASRVRSAALYENYRDWATKQSVYVLSAIAFGRNLAERPEIKAAKVEAARGFEGLKLLF